MSYKERIIGKRIYNPLLENAQAEDLGHYIPASTDELAFHTFEILLDHYSPLLLDIRGDRQMCWAGQDGILRWSSYDCVKGEDSVYLLMFHMQGSPNDTLASLILDLQTDLVTAVLSDAGLNADRPRLITSRVYHGAIRRPGRPPLTCRHHPTDELVGKRILWQYNPRDEVLHIFYSKDRFRLGYGETKLVDHPTPTQWKQFVKYIERMGTVYPFYEEPARYFKIRENLYLYLVLEKNLCFRLPHQGGSELLVLLDAKRMRYTGRACGADGAGHVTYGILGAVGEFLSVPDEVEQLPSPYDGDVLADEPRPFPRAQFGLKT